MCGIAGCVDLSGGASAGQLREMVSSMAGALAHRGPDDFGTWVDESGGIALGHRRLSIIDLSEAGHQPMISSHGGQALVDRPKMGFGVPMHTWLRGSLRDWAEDLLEPECMAAEGLLNPDPIRERWKQHLSGDLNWQYSLWPVLVFQQWLRSGGV